MRHKQLECACKGIFPLFAADQVCAGQHIAPLVIASHLQAAAMALEQFKKIIALHQHIIELKEGQPPLQPLLVAFRRQHAVN